MLGRGELKYRETKGSTDGSAGIPRQRNATRASNQADGVEQTRSAGM